MFAASNKLDKNLAIFKLCDAAYNEASTTQRILDYEKEFLCNHLEFLLRVEALSHLFLSQEHPFTQPTIDYRNCIKVSATEVDGVYSILKGSIFTFI